MLATNGLYGHAQKNSLKSALLLLGFVVLIALFWAAWCVIYSAIVDYWWVAQTTYRSGRPAPASTSEVIAAGLARAQAYWWMPLFLSSCWFVVAYFGYADIIRASTGAREVTRKEQPRLYNIIEKCAIAAGLPMPKVHVMRSGALNAYAAGLTPESSVVAVTQGLLQTLDDRELEAVVAHEVTHIKNRDVRLMIVATVFAGGLTLVGKGVANMMSDGNGGDAAALSARGATSGDREATPGVLGAVIVAVVFLCLVHLFAILTYFAISRSREFLADAGAVELTKDADAMISALNKISNSPDEIPGLDANLRAMMFSARAEQLFSTHPTISQRIAALEMHAGGKVRARPLTGPAVTQPGRAGNARPGFGAVGFGRRTARFTSAR